MDEESKVPAEEEFVLDGADDLDDDDDEESPYRDPPDGFLRLRPSQFRGLSATIFFEYPPELGIQRNDESVLEPMGKRCLGYKSYWERICIRNAFKRAGFEKIDKNWTILWSKHQNATQMKELNCLQKINHFPASWCIGRKDRLARTMNAMKRIHGEEFDFHPESFVLPSDKEAFIRQVGSGSSSSQRSSHKASSDMLWIVKPVASSCGRGIKVATTAQVCASLSKNRKLLVQKYLLNPYLIDGKKFDLRIYVLISGIYLDVNDYIAQGLTRISTSNYSLQNLSNRFAHLTNYSINKKSKDFKAGAVDDTCGCETEGFKWSLSAFRAWLSQKESPEIMYRTFERIKELCVKTMIAAESEITPSLHTSANYRTNCFELFGCDVILDSDLNPHLLEVNVSPSLMGSSPLDKKIKGTLLADVFHIVGLYPHDNKILRKYAESSRPLSGVASQCSAKEMPKGVGMSDRTSNPFAFSSLASLLAAQDLWRRNPSPLSLDMSQLDDVDAAWLVLLMAEDEFSRSRSSQFQLVHPVPATVIRYLGLYRSNRFSDHLLARWILDCSKINPARVSRRVPIRFRKPLPKGFEVSDSLRIGKHPNTVPLPTESSRVNDCVEEHYHCRGRDATSTDTNVTDSRHFYSLLKSPAVMDKCSSDLELCNSSTREALPMPPKFENPRRLMTSQLSLISPRNAVHVHPTSDSVSTISGTVLDCLPLSIAPCCVSSPPILVNGGESTSNKLRRIKQLPADNSAQGRCKL